MKRTLPLLVFAILFLFLIQAVGTLVESIYILDLMNTTLDAKILGLLFFFVPLLLLPLFRKFSYPLTWIMCAVLLLARGLFPYLDTANRMLAAGLATAAALSLFLLLLRAGLVHDVRPRSGLPAEQPSYAGLPADQPVLAGLWASGGMALAVSLSVLLRTLDHGIDYSLTSSGGWVGILLGFLLAGLLTRLDLGSRPSVAGKAAGTTSSLLGFFLVFTLVYFAFSAPAVIARWTEGNYTLIVLTVALLACGWVLFSLLSPNLFQRIGQLSLLAWNLAFSASLVGTLLVHGVAFPPSPDSPSVLVGAPAWWQAIPLVLMLLLFPVLFLDLRLFLERLSLAAPTPAQLVPGLLLGCLALILLILISIFSNVWGYIQPVSLFFRGKFWLGFLLPAAGLCLLAWAAARERNASRAVFTTGLYHWAWALLLGLILLGTLLRAIPARRLQVESRNISSLTVMTYNIQAANDASAEKSFDRQLALIRRVSPDILSLQETDTTRISLNNNDYVRYYAENLGYYSYYGPVTVAGTFGTAILSKFPLRNTRSLYTYSDTDEIGVAEAEIDFAGRVFTIYDVHPDGSDAAMLAFARALLDRSKGVPDVIALGDYNLRDYEAAYTLINSVFTNAWTSIYPSKISPDGVDMSGKNRIDHIFISHDLQARHPVYLLPPASATDHPVHWSEILWSNP